MMRGILLFTAIATLSACSAESALKREEKVQAKAAAMTGWDRLFASPATTIPAVNQFGFRASDYAAKGSAFGSEAAAPIMMSSSFAKVPNAATFTATGNSAEAIDTIAFRLDITDPEAADVARERFTTTIRDFLFSAKADGFIPVGQAIATETPATGVLPGAAWRLTRETLSGGTDNRRLTVTFTRPDPKSATSSS